MAGAQQGPTVQLVAAGRINDGIGSLAAARETEHRLLVARCRIAELVVDPLSAGWDTPVQAGHFRSGCAPIEALAEAQRKISAGEADAVAIRGRDLLRSVFQEDRAERGRLMAVYGADHPLPELYTRLALSWATRWGISQEAFRNLAELLFLNHERACRARGDYQSPPAARFERITELFRAVDCANPVVDFEGMVLLAAEPVARRCGVLPARPVALLGVGLGYSRGDGPQHLETIAGYTHLRQAYAAACTSAGVEFGAAFHAGEALLEVYTCYPVVPLAFLLETGLAPDPSALPELLERHPVTVTGGMNLARAAWNNPALNALAAMWERLQEGPERLGLVHGNGGLGYAQGVAILGT